MKDQVTIIGAGLVGSLLSIYLSKRGCKVSIYERRQDMRRETISAGRSINLALSDRGILALQEAGVMDDIRPLCIPMHGRFIHKKDGNTAFQPYGLEGQFINSVSRAGLNARLMDVAESHGVKIVFNKKCQGIDWQKNVILFEDTISNEISRIEGGIIFGSDGAYSAARLAHQFHIDRFHYNQSFIDYGYKELTLLPVNEGFALDKNALHIWPRGNYMLIALPNIDGSFTCTLFFPFEGDPSFQSLNSPEKLSVFFRETFADVVDLMPLLEKEFFDNPTSSLITVKCYPWIFEDSFALIGDAAHAIVPFFGQGMNCGFEDCAVLNGLIDQYNGNWKQIFNAYQQLRKPDADAIADLALNNFVEMRDKVSDEKFLLQKRIEAEFSRKYPGKWVPAYSQVTFSPHIRYSEALSGSLEQEKIMSEVMKLDNIEEQWNSVEVEELMMKLLEPGRA